ncbi:MAG TPA: acyloxyacyl hydrolase [Candidatus Hydrogenedentes bacterium]|nr:acyloxyacyl hydrolase [Candidatus Hydrogenedentota bacterium]
MKRMFWLNWTVVLACCLAGTAVAAEQGKQDAAQSKAESGCAGCCQGAAKADAAKACEKEPVKGSSRVFKLDDAAWQLSITGSGGLPTSSEHADRGGDGMLTGTVDYEIPVMAYGSIGPRIMPLFLYFQSHGDVVWGMGGGLMSRVYTVKNEQRGFFIEGEALVLGHINKFHDDTSYVDFITGGGVGYKCKANWHALVKFEHISNAGMGEDNAGVNTLGLSVGYTF